MTASKSLPARPSLESLRKQAKKLARDIAQWLEEAVGTFPLVFRQIPA